MKRLFYLLYGFILVTCITYSFTMDNPSHNTNPNQLSARDAQTANNNSDSDTYDSDQESDAFIDDERQYEQQEDLHQFSCLFKDCTVVTKSQPEIEAHTLDHFKIKCHGCNTISDASHIHKHFQEQRHEKKYPIPLTYKSWHNHVQLLVDKGLHFLLASVDSDKFRDSAHSFVNSFKDNLSAEDHALLSTVIPTFDGKSITYGNTQSLHNSSVLNSPVVYEEAQECTYHPSPYHSVQPHDSDNSTDEELEECTYQQSPNCIVQSHDSNTNINDAIQSYSPVPIQPKIAITRNPTSKEDESTTKTLLVDKHGQLQELFLCPWIGCAIKKFHKNCSRHLIMHVKMRCFACDKLFYFNRFKSHLLQHNDSDFNKKTLKLRDVVTEKNPNLTSLFLLANLMFDHLKPYVREKFKEPAPPSGSEALLKALKDNFDTALADNNKYLILTLKDTALPSNNVYNSSVLSRPVVYEEAQECTYQQNLDHSVQSHDPKNDTNYAIQSHSPVSIQPKGASTLPQSSPSQSPDKEDESTTKTLLVDDKHGQELFLCPWIGCAIKKFHKNCSQHLITHVKMKCFACDKLFCFSRLKPHLLQHNDSNFNKKTLKLRDVVTEKNPNLTSLFLLANLMFDHLKPYVREKFKEPAPPSGSEALLNVLKDNFDTALTDNNKYLILTLKDTALPSNKRQRTDQTSAAQPSPALLPAAQVLIPSQLEEALPMQEEQNEPSMPFAQEFNCDETTFDWAQLLSPSIQEFNPNFSIGK